MNRKLRMVLSGGLFLGWPASVLCAQAAGNSSPAPSSTRPQTPPAKPAGRVRTKLDGFELSPRSGKSANQIGGASRGLGGAELYAPHSAKAFSTHPVFYWSVVDPAAKSTFHLSGTDGQIVYEAGVTGDHLAYPADAPALEPGMTYRWNVTPENDLLGGMPEPVTFTLVSGVERQAVQNELQAGNTAANVFVEHRIWYDAIAAYSTMLDQAPDDMAARSARANLYDQLPATHDLAVADWAKVH